MDSKWSESSSKFGYMDDQRSVKTHDAYLSNPYKSNLMMEPNNFGFKKMRSMTEESD